MSFFKNKNIITVLISIIMFLYFILALNYSLIWFTSLGSENLSIVDFLLISLISMWPYLVTILLGVFNILKFSLLNYKVFYYITALVVLCCFYLINKLPQNFMSNY